MSEANGKSTAEWLRDESESAEKSVEIHGHTYIVAPVSVTELASRGVRIPAVTGGDSRTQYLDAEWVKQCREVVTLGLVSPRVWEGKSDECPYDQDCVPYSKLAKRNVDILLYRAILDVTGYDVEVKQAVTFRGDAADGEPDRSASEDLGEVAAGRDAASGG